MARGTKRKECITVKWDYNMKYSEGLILPLIGFISMKTVSTTDNSDGCKLKSYLDLYTFKKILNHVLELNAKSNLLNKLNFFQMLEK